ncbi:MAG: efflux transporter outer membrane subunit [Syntrophorhabdaceae bacterium]
MTRYIAIIILTLTIFTGCTMIPEYKRPDAPIPATWPTGPAYKETGTDLEGAEMIDVDWRQVYPDEKMQKVLELALQNNRDLRIAALNVEKYRAAYSVQRAVILPLPDARGSLNNYRIPADLAEKNDASNYRVYNANFGVSSWEIDFFGRIRSLSERALQQYFSTEHARNGVQMSLIAEVANAYILLAADKDNLNLAQSTLAAQESSYSMIKRRFELGASSEIDLNQVTTRVEAARVDVARFTNLTAADENFLNLLVGTQVPASFFPENLEAIKPPKDIAPGVSSAVLLNRPDILEAESLLKAANANIGAARAAFFPAITLTTTIGTTSDQLSGLFKAGAATWSFVPQVTQPIFSSVLAWANLRATKADREIYVARYEKSIQSAFREVADALARRGTIEDQVKAQKSLVGASDRTYKLADARYRNGIDSYLNVLDAQRNLYTAQQGLINIHLARVGNRINMYKVLGGGSMPQQEREKSYD